MLSVLGLGISNTLICFCDSSQLFNISTDPILFILEGSTEWEFFFYERILNSSSHH